MPSPDSAASKVLVIGGTGTVGREVVSQLASAGATVRVFARHPHSISLPQAVEAVTGDLTVPETLDGALDGCQRVFLVWTAPAATTEAAVSRIAAGGRRIVFLSSPHNVKHPFFRQPNPMRDVQIGIEKLVDQTAAAWTILRPGMFASNALAWWGPQLRAGQIVHWPMLRVPTAPVDPRDIAAVAVRTLLGTGHHKREYVLTGPESLTQGEQISTLGRALGRTLTAHEVSAPQARTELASILPPPVMDMLMAAWTAALGRPAYVTSTVQDVTGKPARSFFRWCVDHSELFD